MADYSVSESELIHRVKQKANRGVCMFFAENYQPRRARLNGQHKDQCGPILLRCEATGYILTNDPILIMNRF
jgi:hypothetical protein